MRSDGALNFREFALREPVPLATVHAAVLEFLVGRTDAVLYGAQAVNAYVDEPRTTQDVDLLSTRGADLAEEIRAHLAERFSIAARTRSVPGGKGYRVYQLRKPKNRHLVDVRCVGALPSGRRIAGILVLSPPELVCAKVLGMVQRVKTAKGATDLADLRRMLLAFPKLKSADGPVKDLLCGAGASASVLAAWHDLAADEILPSDEDDM